MSGSTTLTAIGTATIATSSADIEAIFQSAAANIATIPASNQFTYNGNALPQGDGKSVLFIPASVVGNVTVPGGYAYVVMAQGSRANLFNSQSYTSLSDPIVIGDGFNFTGDASVVANGGGPSSVTDTHGPYQYLSNDSIHVAGTGTISTGLGSAVIVDAGANETVNALFNFGVLSNHVTVASGATAKVVEQVGALDILTGAKTTVSLAQLGSTHVNIGFTPGGTPTVPLTPPTSPTMVSNAAQYTSTVFTNQIVVAGNPQPIYESHQRVPATANTFTINDAASVNLIALGVSDAVTISAGASTIFGQASNLIDASRSSTGVFFVGGADTVVAKSIDALSANAPSTASTIIGGMGNSTVFATAGDVFNLGAGANNIFVGGTSASTINASGGGGDFFGGSHGDLLNTSTGYSSRVFVGDGGADTVSAVGRYVQAPVMYAEAGEHLLVVGNAASTIIASTHGGVINAASTTGNNAIFAGYGTSGNETLIGSAISYDSTGSATHDTFVVGANATGAASTVTIDNWHAGDVFYLAGFQQYDTARMDYVIGNSLASGSKGDLSFTLSDNTTISFVGNHPTNYSEAAAF